MSIPRPSPNLWWTLSALAAVGITLLGPFSCSAEAGVFVHWAPCFEGELAPWSPLSDCAYPTIRVWPVVTTAIVASIATLLKLLLLVARQRSNS